MKNDADFGDACCQRAAATSRLAPRQLEGRMEKKAPRNQENLSALSGRFVCFCFTLAAVAVGRKKFNLKIIAALCLLLVGCWLFVVAGCWLLVARQQHVTPPATKNM